MKRSRLLKQLSVARIVDSEQQEEIKKEIDIHISCLDGKIALCKSKQTRLANLIAVFNPDKQLRDPRKMPRRGRYISNLERDIKILDKEIIMYDTAKQDLLDQKNTVFAA